MGKKTWLMKAFKSSSENARPQLPASVPVQVQNVRQIASRPDETTTATKTPDPAQATLPESKPLNRWLEAAQKLQRENPDAHKMMYELFQTHLGLPSGVKTPSDLELSLRKSISDSIDLMTDRQWRIKLGSKNIYIRDLLEKVVKVIGKFKDFASVAASLDPVHAALPLAGLFILLPLLENLSRQDGDVKSGVEMIAKIVERYAAIEQSLAVLPMEHRLNSRIVEFYSLILEFEVTAACYMKKNTLTRWAVPKLEDFVGLRKNIQERDREFESVLLTSQSLQTQYHLIEILKTSDQLLEKLNKEEMKSKALISWLTSIKHGEDHDLAREKLGSKYAHTGQWFMGSGTLRDWASSTDDQEALLWLRGHVGTGKTSLMSIYIQHRLERFQSSSRERLAYFYCSEKEKRPTDSLAVLRSLIAQLGWQRDGLSVATPLQQTYAKADQISGAGQLGIPQCSELLQELVHLLPKTTIVIDALDECSDYEVLLEVLYEMFRASPEGRHVNILVSSRMHVPVNEWFSGCLCVGPADNKEDVMNFIATEVQAHRNRFLSGRISESDRRDIERRLMSVLSKRAENVFRWVELQLQLFFSRKSRLIHPDDVKAKLESLENEMGNGLPNLNTAYAEIYEMNTPQPRIREHSQRVLKWLLLPLIPMRDRGVRQNSFRMARFASTIRAISIDPDGTQDKVVDKEYILNICSNLVLANEADSSFQFAHLSVVEYLRTRMFASSTRQEYGDAEVASQMVVSSLSYINLVVLERKIVPKRRPSISRRNSSNTVPTLGYSVSQFMVVYWPTYYKKGLEMGISDTAIQLFQQSMLSASPSETFMAWIDTFRQVQDLYGDMTFREPNLLTVTSMNLTSVELSITRIVPSELYAGGFPNRALAAAAFGLEDLIRFVPEGELLQQNENKRTSLDIARLWDRENICNILLNERKFDSSRSIYVQAKAAPKIEPSSLEEPAVVLHVPPYNRLNAATWSKRDGQLEE